MKQKHKNRKMEFLHDGFTSTVLNNSLLTCMRDFTVLTMREF